MTRVGLSSVVIGLAVLVGCKGGSPTQPSSPGSQDLTAPVAEAPANQEQLTTLRPTLTVRNGSSSQSGARTYEFQISDRSDFESSAGTVGFFPIALTVTGVAEGADRTTLTVTQDLQPATRLFWRARLVQGTTRSEWSVPRAFKTRIVGYSQPGELYDPLIQGETIGTRVGATTFVANRGLRIEDENAFLRYQLGQTITNGEFSVDVEGLFPNGPDEKMRIFSMMDGTGNLFESPYLLNVQYRGLNGNPPNCIAFKALFGGDDDKLEPDINTRNASVVSLDPTRTYHWKATWSNEFRLVVQDGGIGGNTIYNVGISSDGALYDPPNHHAYLGANNGPFGQEAGSWPGAVYRNVWVASKPRPLSLGSAFRPD